MKASDGESCRQIKKMIACCSPTRKNWLIGNIRHDINLLVGIMTGPCRLKLHLPLMRLEEVATYPESTESGDTSFHLLETMPDAMDRNPIIPRDQNGEVQH